MTNSPKASAFQLNRRRFIGLGAAAGLTATLAACGGGTSPSPTTGATGAPGTAAPAGGGTIKAGISYELGQAGYDPMTTSAALTVAANWHTMEGLTEIDPVEPRKCYPALGAELPKKVDDTTYEVTLRDGAVFHDGSPVTVEDVIFSFERVLDPASKSLYAQFLPFLDKVEKKDDKTVVIKCKYAFSLVAERVAVVKIVPKAAVEKDAKAFDANPIGTGPWKMTDNGGASKVVKFERFDKYTGQRAAKADKMEWQVLPDESTRTNALTSKAVQAIDSVPYLSVDTLKATENVESVQGFGLLFAMFNCGKAPFDNVKNRQAVLHAIDMEKVINIAFLGNAANATSFVHEGHPAYKKAKNVYGQDMAKAKALLAETGLKEMRLLCTDHGWVQKATPIIKESLEAAGLKVEFEQKKSADVYTTITGTEKVDVYDMVVAPGDPSVFGADADLLIRWWYSGDAWTQERMHWKQDPTYTQVQDMLDAASKLTGDEQIAKWHEVFDLLSEIVPMYPLLHRKAPTAWAKEGLVGFKPISLTGLSFLEAGTTK